MNGRQCALTVISIFYFILFSFKCQLLQVLPPPMWFIYLHVHFFFPYVDVVGSAIGFVIFTVLLFSWALTFAIGGERLFGPLWGQLVMYNVADRLGLTGWN